MVEPRGFFAFKALLAGSLDAIALLSPTAWRKFFLTRSAAFRVYRKMQSLMLRNRTVAGAGVQTPRGALRSEDKGNAMTRRPMTLGLSLCHVGIMPAVGGARLGAALTLASTHRRPQCASVREKASCSRCCHDETVQKTILAC